MTIQKRYIYGSLEEHSTSFNAFFQVNGEVKTLNKVVNNVDAIWEFLDLGESDLQKIREVCKQYQQKRPTEIKIIYDCIKGTFEAKYKYESVCSADTGLDSSDIFMDWVKEMEDTIKHI